MKNLMIELGGAHLRSVQGPKMPSSCYFDLKLPPEAPSEPVFGAQISIQDPFKTLV